VEAKRLGGAGKRPVARGKRGNIARRAGNTRRKRKSGEKSKK
jgi:hypothetical protein